MLVVREDDGAVCYADPHIGTLCTHDTLGLRFISYSEDRSDNLMDYGIVVVL